MKYFVCCNHPEIKMRTRVIKYLQKFWYCLQYEFFKEVMEKRRHKYINKLNLF